jgi:ABC-type multidrug transport system permease subunit
MPIVLHLVAKDLKRKLRAPMALIVWLSFPVIFAGMIALAFGGGGDVPKVRLLVVNEDDGFLASALTSVFTSKQASPYFDARTVDAAEGRAAMAAGKASALLTIPKGFSRDLIDAKPVTLRLLRNPAEGILPEIAEQSVGAIADVLDGARRVLDKPIEDVRPYFAEGGRAPSDADIATISLAAKKVIESASPMIFPPAIRLESDLFDGGGSGSTPKAAPKSAGATGAIFLLVLPGVAVYALFLVGDQGMRDVMTERTLGTLRRQLAGPISPGTLILGKALYTAILSFLALLVLTAVGAIAVREPVDPTAFLLLSAALVVAVTGVTSVIYGLARTERQASTLGNMLFLAMGFLGGGFIRVESLPPGLRGIAPLTPLYWGTQGYRAILENGAGAGAILTNVAVLTLMGVVFLALGITALHRAARSGAVA